MQSALLVAHDTQGARHRAFGATEGEARPKDGDLHGLDDREDLEDHAQNRAHHASCAYWVRYVVVLEKVPRSLNNAGEGKAGKQRSLRANGEGIGCVIVQLTLLDLRPRHRTSSSALCSARTSFHVLFTGGNEHETDLEHVELQFIRKVKLIGEQHDEGASLDRSIRGRSKLAPGAAAVSQSPQWRPRSWCGYVCRLRVQRKTNPNPSR